MHSAPVHELRLGSRSNIFVTAALYSSGRSVMPVRVRNLSRMGWLIEAAELPEPGMPVRLDRASVSASGTIVWVNCGRGGIQFDAPVAVGEWLPQGKRDIGQQFVDELFHQKRMRITRSDPVEVQSETEPGLLGELLELRLALERAAEALALDTAVASRHPLTLQAIDCVRQALARLESGAAAHDVTLPTGATA